MLGGLGFEKFCFAESGVVSANADTTPLLFKTLVCWPRSGQL